VPSEIDARFYDRADAHIRLADEHVADISRPSKTLSRWRW
jgi:hypothetical protein